MLWRGEHASDLCRGGAECAQDGGHPGQETTAIKSFVPLHPRGSQLYVWKNILSGESSVLARSYIHENRLQVVANEDHRNHLLHYTAYKKYPIL